MRECFAEIRHAVFFWKLPGERACDVLLEWTLEWKLILGTTLPISDGKVPGVTHSSL